MRFKLLRRFLIVSLLIVAVAATLYTAIVAKLDLRALFATVFIGAIALIEPISTFADRILPVKDLQAKSRPAYGTAKEAEEGYLPERMA